LFSFLLLSVDDLLLHKLVQNLLILCFPEIVSV